MDWSLGRRRGLTAFWAAYAAVTLISAFIYLRIPSSPDQSLFDYMAWLDLHGVPFYSGTFDMTWPGQLVFHELAILIFGVHWWTARAGDFILLQPAVLAIFVFLKRSGFAKAAITAALLYPIIYVTSGAWTAGHRDFTGMHFLIAAAIFALPGERPRRWGPLVAGMLAGYATMIRPTYLLFAPLVFLSGLHKWKRDAEWTEGALRQGSIFALGTLTPAIVFALLGLAHGTLQAWYVDSIRFVFDVYPSAGGRARLFGTALSLLVGQLWWLTIIGGLGALLWLWSGRSRHGLWLICAMGLTAFVSYLVQNKGFGYHLAGAIPLIVMLGCAGADVTLAGPLRLAPVRSGAGVLIALLLVAGVSLRIVHALRPMAPSAARMQSSPLKLDDSLALAQIIRSESAPDDTMLEWGWQYQVPFLAQRRSATRLVNVPAVKLIKPGQPTFGAWLTDFDRALTAHPPKFILVETAELAPTGGQDAQHSIVGIVQRHIGSGYVVRDRRQGVVLLKRLADEPRSDAGKRNAT